MHLVGGQVLFSRCKVGGPDDFLFLLGMGHVLFSAAEIPLRRKRISTNYSREWDNVAHLVVVKAASHWFQHTGNLCPADKNRLDTPPKYFKEDYRSVHSFMLPGFGLLKTSKT